MGEDGKTYKAICFDLDGTLLPMDLEQFLHDYYHRIGVFAGSKGLDARRFMEALDSGVKVVMTSDDGSTNHDRFWNKFYEVYPESNPKAQEIAAEFYRTDFDRIGDGVIANPAVVSTIELLKEKGYPLVLTTMPLFPRIAVEKRLGWADLDPESFMHITSYENSTSIKPKLDYYQENLDELGLKGEDVLMVGNNTLDDLAFCKLGADAYLVTDFLLDPIGFDIDSVKHGSFEDFYEWCKGLPDRVGSSSIGDNRTHAAISE